MSDGYGFVRFADRVNRTHRPHAVWHERHKDALFGSLGLVWQAEQGVHVGSGHKRMHHDGKVVRTGALIQGSPGIPGSSMKGALRSRYEAITRSCVQELPKDRASVRSLTHRDIKTAVLTRGALDEAVFRDACKQRELCPACALFGRMSLRGRVTVRDLSCIGDVAFEIARIALQFRPNLHHAGQARPVESKRGQEQFEVSRLHGRKFAGNMRPSSKQAGSALAPRAPQPQRDQREPRWQYIEVIPAGSRIAGDLVLFNVSREELGGLLGALGRIPTSTLKIGGGKGNGFGRMRLIDIRYDLRDHADRPQHVDQSVEKEWRAKLTASHDHWPNGEAELVCIHQGDC